MKSQFTFQFVNRDERLSRKEFNKRFIVRLYPNSKDTHNNSLIGYDRFFSLMKGEDQQDRFIKKMKELKSGKVDIRLKRGIRITVVLKLK